MTKIALSILALAALSTASLADRNRQDFKTHGFQTSGSVVAESAPLPVYRSHTFMNDDGGKQGGR